MDIYSLLEGYQGFQWDKGNSSKSWLKHEVTPGEAEQVFFNGPFLFDDTKHSGGERRLLAFGKTDDNRCLLIAFTIRETRIRVISARNMNKKERGLVLN